MRGKPRGEDRAHHDQQAGHDAQRGEEADHTRDAPGQAGEGLDGGRDVDDADIGELGHDAILQGSDPAAGLADGFFAVDAPSSIDLFAVDSFIHTQGREDGLGSVLQIGAGEDEAEERFDRLLIARADAGDGGVQRDALNAEGDEIAQFDAGEVQHFVQHRHLNALKLVVK